MSLQIEYLVQKEKYQDLIREAEQDQLRRAAKPLSDQSGLHRSLAVWIGSQLVRWGSRLQLYGSVSGPSTPATQTK